MALILKDNSLSLPYKGFTLNQLSGDTAVLFGGFEGKNNSASPTSNSYSFSSKDKSWKKLDERFDSVAKKIILPEARAFHASATYRGSQFFVFGGLTQGSYD